MNKFPLGSLDLIDALEKLYPELAYEPGDTLETMAHRAGQRSVVTFLKQWRDRPDTQPRPGSARGEGRSVRRVSAES